MNSTALICALALAVTGGCASTMPELHHSTTAAEPPVTPAATVVIQNSSLPAATVSVGYRAVLNAGGGVAPYRWKLSSGTLPAGLSFDESRGIVVGVPEQAGNASLAIAVGDSAGATSTGTLALSVLPGSWNTTYYVDAAGGGDNNGGTSESTAWKTLARVNRASFAPGDRVLLKRGCTWREQLNFPSSGQAGQPILVDAYGTGNAPVLSGADLVAVSAWKVCGTCQGYVWTAAVPQQPNIVLFNGSPGKRETSIAGLASATEWFWSGGVLYVWFTGNPGYSYTKPGVEAGSRLFGIGLFGISNVTIQNLQVVGANGKPSNGGVYAQVSANGKSTHDVSFHNLTVAYGAGDGIHLEDCNACIVAGANVSGMARSGITLVSAHPSYPVTSGAFLRNTVANNAYDGIGTFGCAIGASCQGIAEPSGLFLAGLVFMNNTVHDNGAGIYLRWTNRSTVAANLTYHNTNASIGGEREGIELEASSNNMVESNLVYGNSMSGIELSADLGAGTRSTGSSGNVVAYNAIHDNGQNGLFTNSAPTANNIFRYNVVWNHLSGECFLANGTGHQFYGNTCANNSTGIDLYTSKTTPSTGSITVKNNVFAGSLHQAVKIEPGVATSTLTFDHNDYYNGSALPSFEWSGTRGDLSVWQAKFSYDAHSMVANPQFVSSAPDAPGDLALQRGSPIVGKGQALGPAAGTGLDSASVWPGDVNLVSQDAAWSVGAFLLNP
jgi:Right handed beta helix region/Putative Ig domain